MENINLIIGLILVELFTSVPLFIFIMYYKKIKLRVILKKIIIFSLILLGLLGISLVLFLNYKEKIIAEIYFGSNLFYLLVFFGLIILALFILILIMKN